MTDNTQLNSCLIFAHRGAQKEAAENTRAAFDRALQYPIDGIETDVQLSRDEVPVLWHDRNLDKLGLPDHCIDDLDFKQLEKLDFAGYFSAGAEPESVLTLKEFINAYRGRCQLNLEIKNCYAESQERQESRILQTLAITKALTIDDGFISSFDLSCLIFANQHACHLPLFYLLTRHHSLIDIEYLLKEQPFLSGFCLPVQILNNIAVELLREYSKRIVTYTCNSKKDIQKALDLKVDIIITDYPALALKMRRKR
ncbi:MAG: glycerophosphodiester phosphodiesterase [Methylococcaceae bacterium]